MTDHKDLTTWPKYNTFVKANKLYGMGKYKKALVIYRKLEVEGKEYGEDISRLICICENVLRKKKNLEDIERYIIKKCYEFRYIFVASFLPLIITILFLCTFKAALLIISVLLGTLFTTLYRINRFGNITPSQWDNVEKKGNYFYDFSRFMIRCKNCGRYGNNTARWSTHEVLGDTEIYYTICKYCGKDATPDVYFDQKDEVRK